MVESSVAWVPLNQFLQKAFGQRVAFRYPELVTFTARFFALATSTSVAGYPVPSWRDEKRTFRLTESLASSKYVATVIPTTRLLAGSTSTDKTSPGLV